jgi:dihydrodipicolinate synthase/N-acetylneuraminate lyase
MITFASDSSQPHSMKRPVKGIIPPMITPLLAPDTLDRQAVVNMVERLVAAEVSGIFVLGTTGEAQALSRHLRYELVELVCSAVQGRVPILVSISDTALEESVAFADCARDFGASAVVLAAPYYFALSQEELLGYVERVARRISLPIYLYNIPSLTKIAFAPETVRAAADIPNVIGFKDSSGNMTYLAEVIAILRDRPDFSILCGPEELLTEAVRLGAHGGISGGANLWPELYVGLYRAAAAGDAAEIDRLQRTVLQISTSVYRRKPEPSSYLRGLKCAVSAMGYCRNVLAEPFEPLSGTDASEIRAGLMKCGLEPVLDPELK